MRRRNHKLAIAEGVGFHIAGLIVFVTQWSDASAGERLIGGAIVMLCGVVSAELAHLSRDKSGDR